MKKLAKNPWVLMTLFYTVIILIGIVGLTLSHLSHHGFYTYSFTPIRVSDEFLWWQPLGILIITAGLCVLLRKTLRWSWSYVLLITSCWTIPFPALFFWSRVHQPSPPYMRVPTFTYWGRDFNAIEGWHYATVGSKFVCENGFIFLVFAAFPILLLWINRSLIEKRRQWLWTAVLPICFVLSLMPFLTMQVWVFGSIGHRIHDKCTAQLQEIHIALLHYAAEHENRLPVAKDYQELLPQIEPYFDKSKWYRHSYLDHCLIGNAVDRLPQPFLWDSSLSGKEVVRDGSWYPWHSIDMDTDDIREHPNSPAFCGTENGFYMVGKRWVECPYVYSKKRFIYTWYTQPLQTKDFNFKGFRVITERDKQEP